jgi:hypothetical protein
MKLLGVQGTLPALNTKKGYKGMLKLQDGTKKNDKLLVTHLNLYQTNQ